MQATEQKPAGRHYSHFALMILTSTVIMYGLMYLNTYEVSHVTFSQTRLWMALIMGAAMAFIMMAFMWRMYPRRNLNVAILGGSIVLFVVALWLVRSQRTVDDISYMSAMIPHHSIAIMTSERAQIRDPRVRKLADGIIRAQVKEIGEMKALIADLREHPPHKDVPPIPSYRKQGASPPAPD